MLLPTTNNYIQYLTRKGVVKTIDVVFEDFFTYKKYTVSKINEDYFILALFENGVKKSGLTFENVQNVDMLAFINSNFFDIDLIPQNAFFSSEFVSVLKYDISYNRLIENLDFPNPDESFLFNYCQKYYPTANFSIFPFFHGWSTTSPLLNANKNLLFYARVTGGASSIVATLIYPQSPEFSLSNFYYTAFNPSNFNLFNKLEASTGTNFSGITAVTSVNTFSTVTGYVAVFDNLFFD